MIRGTWVWNRERGELVPKSWRRHKERIERGDFPCPMVARNGLPDIWNPCDGKHYDNLRDYEKSLPKGHHIVEKGEPGWDSPQARPVTVNRQEVRQTILDSWDQLESK